MNFLPLLNIEYYKLLISVFGKLIPGYGTKPSIFKRQYADNKPNRHGKAYSDRSINLKAFKEECMLWIL